MADLGNQRREAWPGLRTFSKAVSESPGLFSLDKRTGDWCNQLTDALETSTPQWSQVLH